jgi:ABC-type multidrug transport system fused ATPase/permease subunit
MKRTLAAALAVLALTAAPAMAQFTDVNAIIQSIGSNEFTRAADKVSGASSARVEKLSTFLGASSAGQRLVRAEVLHERSLSRLHSNLMLSPIAMQAIRASGFEVNQIVALSLDSEGSAILYADDL